MATSSLTSINGVSSGIDTTALINAIVAQKGTNLTRLQAQKDLNDKRTTALTAMKASLSALYLSMAVLQDKFNSRTVTSTDTTNAYVTATATGATDGTFDLTVKTVATKGRISAQIDSLTGFTKNMAVASPSDSASSYIFTQTTPATTASFAIQGTDGVIKTVTLGATSNTLNGLRDAINASGAGITATIVNMGKGDKPYQLVLTAKDTGTGTTKGVVTIADVTNQTALADGAVVTGTAVNTLGIAAGSAGPREDVNNPGSVLLDGKGNPQTFLNDGLTSDLSGATAKDADFILNGIELTRTTNLVKDAADGMVFTLKQGDQTGTTTLSVTPDKAGATAAMQDFITKYNQLVKDYKSASTSTKNADGSINRAALSNDSGTRSLMTSLQSALAGSSAGMPTSSAYKTLASMGLTTQADGTLFLNTVAFQNAVGNDLGAVQRLFQFSGTSTNQGVTFNSAGANTATGNVDFAITTDVTGTWGTLTKKDANGNTVASSGPLLVSNGILAGTGAFEGLNLSVTGTGTGALTLSRGAGRTAQDLISSATSLVSGGITSILNAINTQNTNLSSQIASAQSTLDRQKQFLKAQFAKMESAVGQMRASAGALTGA